MADPAPKVSARKASSPLLEPRGAKKARPLGDADENGIASSPFYMLRCSDADLPISADDFSRLSSLFPLLSPLLFGHPSMKSKEIKTNDLGWKVLQIPDYLGISKEDFFRVIDCALHSQMPLPFELRETLHKLGGCPSLERRLASPTRPENDENGIFSWRFEAVSHSDRCAKLQEEGWQLVNIYDGLNDDGDRSPCCGRDPAENHMAVFRRERRTKANDEKPTRPEEDIGGRYLWRRADGASDEIVRLQEDEGWQLIRMDENKDDPDRGGYRGGYNDYGSGGGGTGEALLRKERLLPATTTEETAE